MEVARNVLMTLTSGVVRLAVTVGVIAAVGFFIVKPALDATKEISQTFKNQVPETSILNAQVQDAIRASSSEGRRQRHLLAQLQREIRRVQRTGGIPEVKRMSGCLRKAQADLAQAVRCVRRVR